MNYESVRIGYGGKIKYGISHNNTSHIIRAYDFFLSFETVGMELIDFNSFWLCCGKDPQKKFAGAWVLSAGDRVIAYLHDAQRTEFNRQEHKTYLRLFFVGANDVQEAFIDLRRTGALKVRIAFVSRVPELFLIVAGGKGECNWQQKTNWLVADSHRFQRWMPLIPLLVERGLVERSDRAAERPFNNIFASPWGIHQQPAQQVQQVQQVQQIASAAPAAPAAPVEIPWATATDEMFRPKSPVYEPDEYDPTRPDISCLNELPPSPKVEKPKVKPKAKTTVDWNAFAALMAKK